MPRINEVEPEQAKGQLKEIYDTLIAKRGKVSEVLKVQSLHPASILSHLNLYMDIMFAKTELSRAEKEMIAVVVSVANGCIYCQTHHAEALNQYWKNNDKVKQLITDYLKAELTYKEQALCAFAVHLTKHPQEHEQASHTVMLKTAGISDKGILDAALVTGYFNFVNRMVLSLGVELEADNGTGYKY